MRLVLFDTLQRDLLKPFTGIRAVADIRVGILTCRERWEKMTRLRADVLTAAYLQPAYAGIPEQENILVNASVLPDEEMVQQVLNLKTGEAIVVDGELIAGVAPYFDSLNIGDISPALFSKVFPANAALKKLTYPWQIFQWNDEFIRRDYNLLSANSKSMATSPVGSWVAPQNIFMEEGVNISSCYINASEGPVYLGKNAVVMEGCMIRGPFFMGEGSVLKMGTKIYGATSLGPHCVAGGEIKNSVMLGYSNKAHDGYLGDSVVGEWCNLGAGTSNSNLRNDAATVYLDHGDNKKVAVGQKCGLILGDYSRSALNTSFNTGTFAGISSNIFGQGFAPRYLPDFTWGFTHRYIFDKAIEHIGNWKKLKQQELTSTEINIIDHLYKQ